LTHRASQSSTGLASSVQSTSLPATSLRRSPSREERGASEVVENVVGTLIATGTYDAIRAAVQRFTEHMKGRAEVAEEEEDGA